MKNQWTVFESIESGIINGLVVFADSLDEAREEAKKHAPIFWDELNCFCRFTNDNTNPFKSRVFKEVIVEGDDKAWRGYNMTLLQAENDIKGEDYNFIIFKG